MSIIRVINLLAIMADDHHCLLNLVTTQMIRERIWSRDISMLYHRDYVLPYWDLARSDFVLIVYCPTTQNLPEIPGTLPEICPRRLFIYSP